MKPAQSPQPSGQSSKIPKQSLADQIAAAKAGGWTPVKSANTPLPRSTKGQNTETAPSKTADVRIALVREWKELWQDRTSRIVLLGAAWAIALGIAWGAATYLRKSDEPVKKNEPTAEVAKEQSEKPEDSVTPKERYAIHRSIVEWIPYELPKSQVDRKSQVEIPKADATESPSVANAAPSSSSERLEAKRREIAETGQLKVSTNPEDIRATTEALKEWSRQDAEAARARASKR